MAYQDPYTSGVSGYFQTPAGLVVPNAYLQNSGTKAIAVQEQGLGYGPELSLEQYARWQLMQSRYKWFVMELVYNNDTWVRSCVDYIVDHATLEEATFVDSADPGNDTVATNPNIRAVRAFFDTCNDDLDWNEIYAGILQDQEVYAEAYLYIERPRKGGLPTGLYPLDSRITFPVYDFAGAIMFFAQVWQNQVELFRKDEILYLPAPSLGGRRPTSKIETLYETVTMSKNAIDYNNALFKNGLNIGAIFSIPNASEEDIDDNIRLMEDQYASPANAGRTLILKNDAKLLRDGQILTKDLNFPELLKSNMHATCGVYHVPPALLGVQEGANRSTTDTLERDAYRGTISPKRRRLHRRITSQLIHKMLGRTTVRMIEPLSAQLPSLSQLQAVTEAARVGMQYNDLREMQGLEPVANGQYFVNITPNGGMVRLDETMPGVGDPHFDFAAYQLQHQQDEQANADMAAQGLPPKPGAGQWSPPRSQDMTPTDPIAARIVDVSRSLERNSYGWDSEAEGFLWEDWHGGGVISRRIPRFPGTRGGTFYQTGSGKTRYGLPPSGRSKGAPLNAKDGSPNNNTLTNPKDPNLPKLLTPEQRLQMAAARGQVEALFGQAMTENWTNEQFMTALDQAGWVHAADTQEEFNDAKSARSEARRLSELYPDKAYVLLGADGQYFIMEKPLATLNAQPGVGEQGNSTPTGQPKQAARSLPPPPGLAGWATKISALGGSRGL